VAIPLLAAASWNDRSKGAWVARAVLDAAGDDHDTQALRGILADFDPDGPAEDREAAASAAADWLRSSGLRSNGLAGS
jgi:hypothetical protein